MDWKLISEALFKGRELLTEGKWTTGAFWRDADENRVDHLEDAERFCALGAAYAGFGVKDIGGEEELPYAAEVHQAEELLEACAKDLFETGVVGVNDRIAVEAATRGDSPFGDVAPVLSVYDCALAKIDDNLTD